MYSEHTDANKQKKVESADLPHTAGRARLEVGASKTNPHNLMEEFPLDPQRLGV